MVDKDGGHGQVSERSSATVNDETWTSPGTVLGDRFVVERKLGSGGMGYVVAARHIELGQPVAIKLILPARAMSEEARNRLTREARAAARIKSAHVVRIFDVVSRGPAVPYIVMEYLTGETLRQLLERTGRLPVDRAVDIVLQTCEALAEAHRNATIHRDLKPSNLFLTAIPGRPCFVKVLDFGIAKTNEVDASTLTHSQALLASPAYASPEQLRASKDVDERSDIWSLGVILYESVTGQPPFDGRTLAELSSEILRDAPTPPSAHRADLSDELERVILRCLEKEPANRFESVESLVLALEPFAPAAARECLTYIRDLGDSKQALPAERDESSIGASHHRSTLTHASVASAAVRASPKWINHLVIASVMAAALLWLAIAITPNGAQPENTKSPTANAQRVEPRVATTAPPPPSVTFALEHLAPGAEVRGRAAPAPEPAPSPSSAKSRIRPAPARARAPSVPPSASPPAERAEPSKLEALPLNELIDGRK